MSVDVNQVHINMDSLLVEVQEALKSDEEQKTKFIETNFPLMYNMILDLQSKCQLLELDNVALSRQIKEEDD